MADAYYDGSEEYGYSYFYITLTGELDQPLVEEGRASTCRSR